jgi:hypothetical protein
VETAPNGSGERRVGNGRGHGSQDPAFGRLRHQWFPRSGLRVLRDGTPLSCRHDRAMTLIWFIVWLVANAIGDHEPLIVDSANVWAGALILAVALDHGAHHATGGRSGKPSG